MSRFLIAILCLLSRLPFRVLYIFSDIIYFFIYYVARYRRKVVKENLANAFPEKSAKERLKIEKQFFHHLCDLMVETIKLCSMSKEEMKKRCKFLNPELTDKYAEKKQNIIAISGHYGNWEWFSSFSIWRNYEYMPIYKPLRNKTFDKFMIRLREHFGAKTLPKDDTFRTILKYQRQQIFSIYGFLGDQTPTVRNIHYWTTFLNQDTPILQGTERIAAKLNQAVIFVDMRKVKRGYYEINLIPLFEDAKNTAPNEITEKHTRVLESIINAEPAYWLWSHKRWKHKRNE